ncbi:hypothetical protein ANCCAN_08837 [Ancylostoma caninum]|uniref:Uncharacterized protein n=1 Tax=Ancylostoma caninum TaxID=29170 RepID=A0A368GQ14_ANCCA|nr:hypothetical protein ANCCAN_08837 [Ancylostoma caninum]
MKTVIFLLAVISTAPACCQQPFQSHPLPGFHQPFRSHPLPGFQQLLLLHPLPATRPPFQSQPLPGFHQPSQSHPLPGFHQPFLSHPLPATRPPPPATPFITTKLPTTRGIVIFKLKGAWSSDQYEIKKYVNDFDNELGLYAKKQEIAFERFGKPIPQEMSGKVTVEYKPTDIVCEEVENFVNNAKKELHKFITKYLVMC